MPHTNSLHAHLLIRKLLLCGNFGFQKLIWQFPTFELCALSLGEVSCEEVEFEIHDWFVGWSQQQVAL